MAREVEVERNKLILHEIAFRYGPRPILSETSLELGLGEIVCILGPSGVGKSTLLNVAAGFLQPQKGSVTCLGHRVTRPGRERCVVTQDDSVFPWLTVYDNVRFGSEIARLANAKQREVVDALLAQLGIDEWAHEFPAVLSGGMRQRVNVARAWANGASFVLMDEPLRSVDGKTRLAILAFLRDRTVADNRGVLLITHDPEEALLAADRIVTLGALGVVSSFESTLLQLSTRERETNPCLLEEMRRLRTLPRR